MLSIKQNSSFTKTSHKPKVLTKSTYFFQRDLVTSQSEQIAYKLNRNMMGKPSF